MPELSMASEAPDSFPPVELQPFIHQVGGHTSMFRFNETTVCKPLCVREYQFYTSLPPELSQFTPEFKGSIEVQLQEDSDGYITVVAYPSESSKQRAVHGNTGLTFPQTTDSQGQVWTGNISPSNECYSMRLLRSGSIEVSTQTEKRFSESKSDGAGQTESLNPWSLKCHKRQLAKMRKDNQQSDCKFILLENVVAHFSCPCVLDLKMGTRQHGDDAPESKKRSQMKKCEATTSAAIGLRVCGMQVYQASSGKYICRNKYYGRSLSVDGFKQALHQFLHNGQCLRQDVIDLIIDKLRHLYTVVEQQNTFRFYSSSLLIMYDGLEKGAADMLMEHTSSVLSSSSSSASSHMTENSTSTPSSQTSLNCSNHNHRSPSSDLSKVDVRMIDFAHATHKDFLEDQNNHNGPDDGYLFGLGNLIKLFEELRQSYVNTS